MDTRAPLRRTSAARTFCCGVPARWLPRALAGGILAAALLCALRFEPHRLQATARVLQGVLCATGLAAAAWILRSAAAEARTVVTVEGDGLVVAHGRREERVTFERIERLEFEWPFGPARRLLPAAALVDREGRVCRIPAIVDRGDELVEALLEASRRDDLRAWATSLNLAPRMGRARWIVGAGYVGASAVVLAALAFLLR